MTDIRKMIEDRLDIYTKAGFPTFIEKTVLTKGHEGLPAKLPKGVKRRAAKQCFKNATDLVLRTPGLTYVEGFALSTLVPDFPVHHAWAEDADGNVIDVTWDHPAKCFYLGVPFDVVALLDETAKNEYYGLLCPGDMFNIDLMTRLVPSIADDVKAIRAKLAENPNRISVHA